MTLNFNTQPYFDDFDDNKNFHRILFKPSFAVQARELTQIQTILQDQIGKLGKFVLSDGSKVSGGRYFIDTNTLSLKLSNADIDNLITNIGYFSGSYVVGQTSKCVGFISDVDITNYYLTVKPLINGDKNFSSGESLKIFTTKELALSYVVNSDISSDFIATLATDASISLSGVYGTVNSNYFTINTTSLEEGDLIKIESAQNPYDTYVVTEITTNGVAVVNKPLDENYSNVTVTVTKLASRYVMQVSFDTGVYFSNSTFVKALPQTVIPNVKTQYPSCVIGYEVTETVVDFVDDTSLLDPAQGSSNYTAPGADRYKIYLDLVSKPYVNGNIEDLTSNKFIELLRIKNGNIVSDTTGSQLGAIEDVLARQMYDHAGNFIVKDFNISFHDSSFNDNVGSLQAELSTGKAYIFGYEYAKKSPSFFNVDKGRDTNTLTNQEMITYYGNHISVTNISGDFLNGQSAPRVELHSVASNSANNTTLVATAYVRNIRQVSSTEYYLNLYNVSSSDISNVKSVIKASNNYSTISFSANTVLTNGTLPVIDSDYNSLLYQLPYNNVSSLSNVNFSIDLFDTKTVTSNTTTIGTGSLSKSFPSGTGVVPSDIKKSDFVIVANSTNGAYTKGDYINLDNVTITVTQQGSTQYLATLVFNNGYTGSIGVKYALNVSNASIKPKTVQSNQVYSVKSGILPTTIPYSDICNFKGVFYTEVSDNINSNPVYIGEWNSATTYSKDDVVLIGSELYISNINNNLNKKPEKGVTGWTKLQDVTNNYILNNGQTEYMYDYGYIQAKNYAYQKQVFVLFDYYTHGVGDYINFSSYPTQYSNIPTNIINNKIYDMKNYVDFRPRRTNNLTALQYDDYKIPSTIFSHMSYDMQYYLGRIDKLVLNDSKQFQWLRGIPSYTNYIPPADLKNAMTIATIKINPFTSSESDISITYKRHRRYTMEDIGNLDQRLTNVEYYTSLNMVEKDILSRNIYDNTTGQRMTNGFVVDPFIGYSTMSLPGPENFNKDTQQYNNCSLDLSNQILRPSFKTKKLDPVLVNLNGLIETKKIISFDYTEEELTNQLVSSSTINCNPFDVVSYSGTLTLSPQSDNWVDEQKKPIINIIDSDTAALNAANSIPGQVYNDWNTFYSTHEYTIDASYNKQQVTVQNDTNQVVYDVSAALVKTSDITKELSSSILPYARSLPIKFKASQLAPLTKMYVYVNSRLVNAYILPDENPFGTIQSATIRNSGTGYASNTVVSIPSSNTKNAYVTVEVTSGILTAAQINYRGLGYSSDANTLIAVVNGVGSAGNVHITTLPSLGSDLYSNKFGFCSGTLYLPSDDILKFPSGDLHIIVCDNPNYDFNNCISKSEATFYSSTRQSLVEETITSIRKPYITIASTNGTPSPTKDATIVVPTSKKYTVRDDFNGVPYSSFKSGVIDLPVYLNKKPNSSVVVTWSDSTLDRSANTTYSISPSSLTFSTSNWSTPQSFTLTYDLGNRIAVEADNHLPSYLEFYGSSSDTGYNYSATKPANSWKSSTPLIGVSSCNLIADSKSILTSKTAAISCSSIATKTGSGQVEFVSAFSGNLLPDYLPITVTVSSSNTAVCSVTGVYAPNSTTLTQTNSFTVTKVSDLTNFKVQLSYADTGNSSATVYVTTSCGASYWNGIVGTTTFNHTSTAATISPSIVVQPSSTVRKTTEAGGSTIVLMHLSKQPASNVVVSASSDNLGEGVISGSSTLTFTTSNWATDQTITVTGVSDSSVDGDVAYNLNLSTTSADSSWNGLSSSVGIINLDKTIATPVDGYIDVSVQGANAITATDGSTIAVLVKLSKQPGSNVTVSATSSDTSTGGTISSGSSLTFTTSNWNTQQKVVVAGSASSTQDTDYNVNFVATTASSPQFTTASVKLTNKKIKPTTYTKTLVSSSSTFRVVSSVNPSSWVPDVSIFGYNKYDSGNISSSTQGDCTMSSISKYGTATISLSNWEITGIKGGDTIADGWVRVTVHIANGSDTMYYTDPATIFTSANFPQFASYSAFASRGGQPLSTGNQFKLSNNGGSLGPVQSILLTLYEQQVKISDPAWTSGNAQKGNASSSYNIIGLIPNLSAMGISVEEIVTTTTTELTYDSNSSQLISQNITSTVTSTPNKIWDFNTNFNFGSLNQNQLNGGSEAMVNWVKQFPSLANNPTALSYWTKYFA